MSDLRAALEKARTFVCGLPETGEGVRLLGQIDAALALPPEGGKALGEKELREILAEEWEKAGDWPRSHDLLVIDDPVSPDGTLPLDEYDTVALAAMSRVRQSAGVDARKVVNEQAEDNGLWFVPQTATENYLQRALRQLHEAVEGKSQEACAIEALHSPPPQGVTDAMVAIVERIRLHPEPNALDAPDFQDGWELACERISDAIASLPPTGWRDIANAPTDGTHILAFRAPLGIRFTNLTNPPTVVHWFDDGEDPGFYTSVNAIAPNEPFPATHWMPLPSAPSGLSPAQQGK